MKNLIPFFVLLVLISPIEADDLKSQLDRDLQGVMTKVTDWRHHFHQYPELSNREYETQVR
jgi:amidohydrolase